MKRTKPFDYKTRSTVSGMKLPASSSSSNTKFKRKLHGTTRSNGFKSFLRIVLLIILGGCIVTFSVYAVISIRSSNEDNVVKNYGEIYGFKDIPIYPYSENVFKDSIENITVKEFLNDGYSVYRILPGGSYNLVQSFYKAELPRLNWQLVLDVELSSEDKLPGQYWTKDGTGVRIFTKSNDIWYQKVTEDAAKTGLAEVVRLEQERKQLILDNQTVSLLPDYPWKLTIPGDYYVTYKASTVKDLKIAEIKKMGYQHSVQIIPISIYSGGIYEKYLRDFTKSMGLTIKSQNIVMIHNGSALEASITSSTKDSKVLITLNSFNGNMYAIYFEDKDSPLLQLVKNSLYAPEKKAGQ